MMLRRLVNTSLDLGSYYRHIVISLTDIGYHGSYLQKQGIDVYALNLRSPFDFFKSLYQLVHLLSKYKPTIVQTWMVHSDLLGGLAAKVSGVPHIIWGVRTTDFSVESRSTRVVRWLCARLSFFIPDKIVCAAQASLESSMQAGYDARKLMVIPNGFDVNVLRQQVGAGRLIRQQFGLDIDHVVVGCLGRFNPAKDHANFVQAAGLLAAKYPQCRFMMVGRDLQVDNAQLMGWIRATGFADRFVLLGERPDPAAYLAAMDVFVLSSCTEGFPNVLGEAMAMAVPCVTTDVGDAAFLIGNTGVVVPPRNPKALAQAVAGILDLSPQDRLAMGSKGQARVEREFSMTASTKRFADLYEELMAKT